MEINVSIRTVTINKEDSRKIIRRAIAMARGEEKMSFKTRMAARVAARAVRKAATTASSSDAVAGELPVAITKFPHTEKYASPNQRFVQLLANLYQGMANCGYSSEAEFRAEVARSLYWEWLGEFDALDLGQPKEPNAVLSKETLEALKDLDVRHGTLRKLAYYFTGVEPESRIATGGAYIDRGGVNPIYNG